METLDGKESRAQELLEKCVELAPDFYWGWHDLSEISAQLGHFEVAIDEILEAAEHATEDYLKGHFYSKAAMHASKNNDETRRKEFAAKTLEFDKDFVNQLIESVKTEQKEGGDIDIKRTKEILLAVAPRNLMALDFIKKHEGQDNQ